MNAVDTLSKNVNNMIDKPRDATTMYGVALLLPEAEEPMTTGKSGNMHGASTVSTPAIKAMARNVIYLMFATSAASVGLPLHFAI